MIAHSIEAGVIDQQRLLLGLLCLRLVLKHQVLVGHRDCMGRWGICDYRIREVGTAAEAKFINCALENPYVVPQTRVAQLRGR